MILVSSCLIGEKCRYDGNASFIPTIAKLANDGKAVPCCPEVLGGLPTPREPAEIIGGNATDVLDGNAQIITRKGVDVTTEFIAGAYRTLRLAQENDVSIAIFKERSPSCGSCFIYDGTFSNTKILGMGIATAMLRRHGISVYSEENFENGMKEMIEA